MYHYKIFSSYDTIAYTGAFKCFKQTQKSYIKSLMLSLPLGCSCIVERTVDNTIERYFLCLLNHNNKKCSLHIVNHDFLTYDGNLIKRIVYEG